MRTSAIPRIRKQEAGTSCPDLRGGLAERIVGQPEAIQAIVPYLEVHAAGLAPPGRPAGVFLLLGPTGTGKTRTVEVLAQLLHGSEKSLLRIDCGEFQMEHEVAKLIGAPPGYLGHRETQPWITQQKLNALTSDRSDLSIVLFDEIEKAAPSLMRILLGVLDRATLRLGDASPVNFERTLIFLTSNVGAREMMRELRPGIGFGGAGQRLDRVGQASLHKTFSPEFLNRIDSIVTYRPLGPEALESILQLQLGELQALIRERLGASAFLLEVTPEARQFLLSQGAAPEYGARELRRTIERHLIHPLAGLLAREWDAPASAVRVSIGEGQSRLRFEPAEPADGYWALPAEGDGASEAEAGTPPVWNSRASATLPRSRENTSSRKVTRLVKYR
ncbi:MAG: ATP-dependent Clp protease ATP-binding subunit [Acidobacteria bacterium]|nr:ATP-dependent Clp protease ATP-binding subunit [Acidobacteriota bacterium]